MPLVTRIGDFTLGIIVWRIFWPLVVIYQAIFDDSSLLNSHDASRRRATALREASEVAMRERKRNEPISLPQRRRALSSISQTSKSQPFTIWRKRPVEQNPELSSPLLRLPIELREKIYADVLGHDILHLTQLPKRLGHTRCTTGSTHTSPGDMSRLCFSPSRVQHYRHGEPLNTTASSSGDCIPLLQVSRRIYNEASPLLYRTNTFDINHPQTLIFLARTIRPNRLASIRTLQLTWTGRLPMLEKDVAKEPDDLKTWEEMWGIVGSRMEGLRSLRLRLCLVEDWGTGEWLRFTRIRRTKGCVFFERMLVPLKEKVRGLKEFRLGVEMPEEAEWSLGELEERTRAVVCQPKEDLAKK